MAKKKRIVIVGAGLAGSFLAISLGKKGHTVSVHEARSDLRKSAEDAGRSFNLTLYYRGIHALKKLGIFPHIKKVAIQVEGNVCHLPDNTSYFDSFEKSGQEVLYTVHRKELNAKLLTACERLKRVNVYFNSTCVGINRTKKTIQFLNSKTGKSKTVQADMVIGADGVHSFVRQEVQRGQDSFLHKEYLDWGYKEVPLSKELVKRLTLRSHATHTWPRDNSLFIAFPNHDKTFTLMINLPIKGKESFAALVSEQKIKRYITTFFPSLLPALSEITNALLNRPLGHFISIYTRPWFYEDFLVLVGDAAHGVIPFYGQGMCAAFEDCLVLTDLLERNPNNPKKAFTQFQMDRKRNTDVLADISKENFYELRDKARSSYHVVKAKMHTAMHQWFPKLWYPPLYKMVAHDITPYADAHARFKRQEWIARIFGLYVLSGLLSIGYFFVSKRRNSLIRG